MTKQERAERFLEANRKSPVVYGSVLCMRRGGAYYRLANGQTFRLSAAVCRLVEPRWPWDTERRA